ncbi:MAG: ABC transporter permease [Bdellovibrionales bacterium]|nr:ABC transporter permease [Bdellovibrionales bacterium]
MKDFLKVAVRNVGRNRRRSFITIVTIFLGVLVVSGIRGLLNGFQGEIRSSLTRKIHGDLQIHKKGYQDAVDNDPYKILIPDVAALEKEIQIPELIATAPRLRVFGLLNHQKSQKTTPVMIVGIDSKRELAVCPRLEQAVQAGTVLDSSQEIRSEAIEDDELTEAPPIGTTLSEDAPKAQGQNGIMLTPSLVRGMGAEIGDELVVLIQDKNNMQQAVVVHLVGVVDYAMPTAASKIAWMDFTTLRRAAGLTEGATELALRTQEGADVNEIRDRLTRALDPSLVVETWEELGGFFKDVMGLQNLVFSVILTIVFTIVISGIVNTSLMTVMERTREIGTLMALGYRRRQIMSLFLIEFAAIGVAGGIAGLTAATILLGLLGKKGIIFALPGQTTPTIIYPYATVFFLVSVLGLAIFAALLAGIVPAYRASRMRPVDALRAN